MSLNRPIRWGVLGTAAIATERTIPAMKAATNAIPLAIASRDAQRARVVAQSLGIPRAYAGYEVLLADPDIDAVYVPLPNRLHLEWTVRALEAGKHVLCEKPLCLRASEVTELIAVRQRTGRHVEEAFGYRNHPQWAKLAELLASGAIGSVRAMHAILAKQFLDPADIRNDPAAGGGALFDLGSYAISACNLIAARTPQRVVAALERDPRFGVDRLSSALLDYGDCHAAITVASQSGPDAWATHQQLSVLGATGWLRFTFPFAQARPTACRIELGDHGSVGAVPTATYEFPPVNQYLAQVERFSQLLLGERVASWPIEDALSTTRTIEALFAAAAADHWQTVNA